MNEFALDRFTARGLNLLGTILGGVDVRVLLSARAEHPATVVLESRTVVLDPQRTGLYDLALCSRLLHHRASRRNRSASRPRSDRWLTRHAHERLVPQSHGELRKEFPGIGCLPGRYLPGAALDGLSFVTKSVEWSPLPKLPRSGPHAANRNDTIPSEVRDGGDSWQDPDFEFVQAPELEITGSGDDFRWLLDGIDAGHFPMRTVPGLEELPYLRVPFRLSMGEVFPNLETFEEQISQPENKELIESLMKCYRRKSEVRQERSNLGRHSRHGARLDTNRLVDAVMARRTHSRPRLFRRRASTIEPVFDPYEHLVTIAFDINDLKRPSDWWVESRRPETHRFLACMITAYQRLDVDCIVIGFADQMLVLPDGRPFCLHLTMPVKSIGEELDDAFWNRMGQLLNRPPKFPGVDSCFHPLALQDITHGLDRAAREQDHSYRTILWWARRGMPEEFPQFRTKEFLMRTADSVDSQMLAVERRFDGTLDTLASFLPKDLRNLGQPGQYLSGIEMP